jgi:hypothetical protein
MKLRNKSARERVLPELEWDETEASLVQFFARSRGEYER